VKHNEVGPRAISRDERGRAGDAIHRCAFGRARRAESRRHQKIDIALKSVF